MLEIKSNYRVAYDKFWQDIKQMDPEAITAARAVHYNLDTRQFSVLFFNEEYLLDSDNESIWRKADGFVPDIMDAIIILNYLAYARPLPITAPRWVSLKEIPGAMIFYPAFRKSCIFSLIEAFGQQVERLTTIARCLGSQPSSIGDSSIIINAFPEIPLCVAVWEGDEEIEANATILYDPSIGPMLHNESIIGLGLSLTNKLCKLAMEKDEHVPSSSSSTAANS